MTAIVLNTLTGAVSEYDWSFKSIAAAHAASDTALASLGGDSDNGVAIVGEVRGGIPAAANVQMVGSVFLGLDGAGDGTLLVQGLETTWEVPVVARGRGVSVAKPGRGIRESYLGFGYRNMSGHAFTLHRIEADVFLSKTRRS